MYCAQNEMCRERKSEISMAGCVYWVCLPAAAQDIDTQLVADVGIGFYPDLMQQRPKDRAAWSREKVLLFWTYITNNRLRNIYQELSDVESMPETELASSVVEDAPIYEPDSFPTTKLSDA